MSQFEDAFRASINEIEREAKRLGVPLEVLAVEAGVSTSRLREWRRRTPRTVRLVGALQSAIEAKRQSLAAA